MVVEVVTLCGAGEVAMLSHYLCHSREEDYLDLKRMERVQEILEATERQAAASLQA